MKKGIDHIGLLVSFFCHDGKGNMVMDKRGAKARDENGRWEVGGGAIEFGESAEETLRKEVKEEYGCTVLHSEFLGYRDIFRENDGVKSHWTSLDFKVLIDPKELRNGEPGKIDEVALFPIGEFPEPLHSQFHTFFNKYKNQLTHLS